MIAMLLTYFFLLKNRFFKTIKLFSEMRNLDVRIHAGQSTGILDGLTSVWHHCEDSDTTFLYNEGRIFKLRESEEADILAK